MIASNNTIDDRFLYKGVIQEAYAAAVNILAAEYLLRHYHPDKYSEMIEKLHALTDDELVALYIKLSEGDLLTHHISTLGAMITHGNYNSLWADLIDFLEGDRK